MKLVKKCSLKAISLLLSFLMLLSLLPASIFAVDTDVDNSKSAEEAKGSASSAVFEVETLRGESIKHFHLEDGTYMAVQYSVPVHYLDENSEWQNIDNTLLEAGNEYATKNQRVKFVKKITGNESLFTLHENNHKITMSLNGAIKKTTGVAVNTATQFDESATTLQKIITLDQLSSKIIYENILENIDLEYIVDSNNIKENIIVKEKQLSYCYTFIIKLNNLVAEIVESGDVFIKDVSTNDVVYVIPAPIVYDANHEYANPGVANYQLEKTGNGEYSLTVCVDSDWMNSESRAYPVVIDPPLNTSSADVTDTYISISNGSVANGSSNNLNVGENYLSYWKSSTLPTLPDYAYVTSATFSAVITNASSNYVGIHQVTSNWDASLTSSDSSSGVIDSTVLDYCCLDDIGEAGTRVYWDITSLWNYWESEPEENYGICLKLVEDTIVNGNSVFASNDSADASQRPFLTVSYKDQFGIEDYWTYSSQSSGLAGSGSVNLATGNLVFNIDALSTTDSLIPFATSLVHNAELSPYLFTRLTRDVPYSFATAAGGFKTNMNQSIVPRTYYSPEGIEESYYIYTDADGTAHAFFKSTNVDEENVYYDEDGLGLKLFVNTSSYVMEDTSHNVYTFTKKDEKDSYTAAGGFLTSIADVNGNVLSIVCNSYGRPNTIKITPVNGSAITQMKIYYISSGVIKYFLNPTTQQAVLLYYSSSYNGTVGSGYRYLRKVVYAHQVNSTSTSNWDTYYTNGEHSNIITDAVCYYDYQSDGKLIKTRDDKQQIELHYTYGTDGKVTEVQEFAGASSNLTAGQKLSIHYSVDHTIVQTSGTDDVYGNDDDIKTYYQFDNEGRCVSSYSTDVSGYMFYGETSGEYETGNNKTNNKLKSRSNVSDTASNYLVNSDFTVNGIYSLTNWSTTGNVHALTTASSDFVYYNQSYGEPERIEMSVSAGETAKITQRVSLYSGTYSFSAAIFAEDDANVTVRLKAKSVNDSSRVFTKDVVAMKHFSMVENLESCLVFSVDKGASNKEVFDISIEVIGKSGASNDCVRLSYATLAKAVGITPHNKVAYGSFDLSLANGSGTVDYSNFWFTHGGASTLYKISEPDIGFSLKLTGAGIGNESYVSQVIYQASDAETAAFASGSPNFSVEGRQYRISGRGKSANNYICSSSTFGITLVVTYEYRDGDTIYETYHVPFNKYTDALQFASGLYTTRTELPTTDGGVAPVIVQKIEVRCEFNNQDGVAYFDEIAVCYVGTDEGISQYEYYEDNGMLKKASAGTSQIWYKYDGTNLTQEITRRGATVYVYENDRVVEERFYNHYGTVGSDFYGFTEPSVSSARTVTEYEYNAYGMLTKSTITSASGSIVTSSKYNTTSGSHIFGAKKSETDALGNTTQYFYDNSYGYLLATIYPDGNGVSYTYDALGRMVCATPAVASGTTYSPVSGAEEVSYEYNATTGRLDQISTDSTTYSFTYDVFGNTDQIKVGNNVLSNHSYNSNNGKLNTLTYGNGTSVHYTYDELDRISEICYTANGSSVYETAYKYTYDAAGYLHELYDYINETVTTYNYDSSGLLREYYLSYIGNGEGQVGSIEYYYDPSNENRIVEKSFYRDYTYSNGSGELIFSTGIGYNDNDGSISSINTYSGYSGIHSSYDYDAFGRKSEATYSIRTHEGSRQVIQTYSYSSNGSNTSLQISGVSTSVNDGAYESVTYTYDDNGNITEVRINGTVKYSYSYDDLGQLLRENNAVAGRTYVYSYDNAGNILSEKVYSYTTAATLSSLTPLESHVYTYGNANWGDLLTSYDGSAISYDGIGNPLSYRGMAFSWTQGRRLETILLENKELSFTYNDEGIRTTKTVNGVTHYYNLEGSSIVDESWTDASGIEHIIIYIYDETGAPIGMAYRKSTYSANEYDMYLFVKNVKGDVTSVIDEDGTTLVTYVYNAWGEIVSQTYANGGASTAVVYNPFRYRGYYYDSETGLYYVSSRYYDPEIGRFINADSVIAGTGENVLGCNMFAYCFNNPVNMSDPTGNWPSWSTILKAAAIAVTAVAVVAAVAVSIATFGATSIATTMVVSSAITIAAKTLEVAVLQGKKSASEGKNTGQVATDIIESVFDNGVGTVAKTAVTKTVGYAAGFYSQSSSFQDVMQLQKMDGYNLKTLAGAATYEVANRFTDLKNCVSATASKGSIFMSYGLAGLNVVSTVISIFADDPVQRATSRGYTLK